MLCVTGVTGDSDAMQVPEVVEWARSISWMDGIKNDLNDAFIL